MQINGSWLNRKPKQSCKMGPQRTLHHHLFTFPKFRTSHIVGKKQQDKNNASKGKEELPSAGTSQTPTLESLDYNASRYLLKIIQVTNVKFSERVIVSPLLKHTWNGVVSESNAVHHLPRFKVLRETGWVIIQVREKVPTLGPGSLESRKGTGCSRGLCSKPILLYKRSTWQVEEQ